MASFLFDNTYLMKTWNEANANLIKTLQNWSDAGLNSYTPHPTLGQLTMREMCNFTIYHKRLHHQDILHCALMIKKV